MPGRSFNSGDYRYGFNGKENDPETVSNGEGTQDYGMRIYNPALGKFLSVDPLTQSYPHYTPYQFAGNNPIKYIDLDGLEEVDPVDRFYKTTPQIDMTNAPGGSKLNAAGYARNGPWFWRQVLEAHPEMFSPDNVAKIKAGRAPIVNDKWIEFNPTHAEYKGGKLIHHHIEQGRIAAGIPEKVHTDFFSKLHPNLKGSGLMNKALGIFGLFGDFAGYANGNPDSWITMFSGSRYSSPEAAIGKVIKDWDSGLYATITDVSQTRNTGGLLLTKTLTYDVYSSTAYDEKKRSILELIKLKQ